MSLPSLQSVSHDEARAQFGALVDGELSGDERGRVEAHLSGCDVCQVGWQRYARAVEGVRALPRAKSPKPLSSLLLARARRRSHLGLWRSFAETAHVGPFMALVLSAACAALLFALLTR